MTPTPPTCPVCGRADIARNVAEALAAPWAGGVAGRRAVPARSLASWRALLPAPEPPAPPALPSAPGGGAAMWTVDAVTVVGGAIGAVATLFALLTVATMRPSANVEFAPPALAPLVAVALGAGLVVVAAAAWRRAWTRRRGSSEAAATRRAAATARAALAAYAAQCRRHARLVERHGRLCYCGQCDLVFLPGEARAVAPEEAATAFLVDAPDPTEPEPPWWLPDYVRWDVTVTAVPWEARGRAVEAVALILWCDDGEASRRLATLPAAVLRDAPADEAGPMAHWLRETGAIVEATPARPAPLAGR